MTPDKACRLVGGYGMARTPTFFRLWMPYVFERIEVPGKRHAFLPLNRDYVPLGTRREAGFVKYDEAEVVRQHAVLFARDPAKLEGVWTNVSGASHWLYDDSTSSKVDYFARLERLMARQMEMIA